MSDMSPPVTLTCILCIMLGISIIVTTLSGSMCPVYDNFSEHFNNATVDHDDGDAKLDDDDYDDDDDDDDTAPPQLAHQDGIENFSSTPGGRVSSAHVLSNLHSVIKSTTSGALSALQARKAKHGTTKPARSTDRETYAPHESNRAAPEPYAGTEFSQWQNDDRVSMR